MSCCSTASARWPQSYYDEPGRGTLAATSPVHRMEVEDTAAYPGFAERIEPNGTLGTTTLESGELQVLFASGKILALSARQAASGGADPMGLAHAAHRTVLHDFIGAEQSSRAPAFSGRSALGVQQLIESIMESSRAGCAVSLAPAAQTGSMPR